MGKEIRMRFYFCKRTASRASNGHALRILGSDNYLVLNDWVGLNTTQAYKTKINLLYF